MKVNQQEMENTEKGKEIEALLDVLKEDAAAGEVEMAMLAEELKRIKVIAEEAEAVSEQKVEKMSEIVIDAAAVESPKSEYEDAGYEEDKENDGYVDIELNVGEAGEHGGPLALRFPSNRTGLNRERVFQVLNGDEIIRDEVWQAAVAYVASDHNNTLLESFRSAGLLALFDELYDSSHVEAFRASL